MLFVSSAHCLGVLLLLLFVVYCGVRRLCGISVMPMIWEGHEITPEGIAHPNILIYDRVSFNLM